MIELRVIDILARQKWLDQSSKLVQQAVQEVFKASGTAAQPVVNFLHGTWLGHPLHPLLTDVPIGAWTAALVLDVLGTVSDHDFEASADAVIALGLVGAVGSAVAGLTDWKDLDTKPLWVGLVHGVLNLSATMLYATSLLRRRGALGRVQPWLAIWLWCSRPTSAATWSTVSRSASTTPIRSGSR